MKDTYTFILAAITGAAIWIVVPMVVGIHEAWDSPFFYPLMVVASLVFGVVNPRWAWRWGLVIGLSQLVLFSIEVVIKPPSLWPLGLVSISIFSLGYAITSQVGGFCRMVWDRVRANK